MAISTGTGILAGAGLGSLGAIFGASAGRSGARKARKSQEQMFSMIWNALAPYREAGTNALSAVQDLLGLSEDPTFKFEQTPEFAFAQEQGEQALEREQSSKGRRLGGRAVKEAQRFTTGLTQSQIGNTINRLMGVAGLGLNAAGTSSNAAITTGQNVGATNIFSGQATAQGIAGVTGALTGGIQNFIALDQYNKLLEAIQ